MAKSQKQNTGSFPTMGTVAAPVNASAAPSRNTTALPKRVTAGGMLEGATANHRAQIQERMGASLRITTALYQPNAAEASATRRNTRIVPSAVGNRDFWDKRNSGV